MDVGDERAPLAGDIAQGRVERGEDVDDVGPGWQADAPRLRRPVAGVVDRPDDDRVAGRDERVQPVEGMRDALAHRGHDRERGGRVPVGREHVVAADRERDEARDRGA
ncbi:MAG: hypothetical protein Q8K79_11915 [Solirubrobacteraceae bacterium]|nr:hypothetical protein [Solirubrobacteraceae bacterium]